ncbi:DUF2752 domain-containing protein [Rubripirellula amarantea]|nr:DUF2752 domain-containing protein [Rubripirellula amarantea]
MSIPASDTASPDPVASDLVSARALPSEGSEPSEVRSSDCVSLDLGNRQSLDPGVFLPRNDWLAVFRPLALIVAVIPLVLLGVSRTLVPDSDGLGTHQQLGLPPCSMRVVMGVRCPACGMTTSWAYFTRGEWRASIESNAGGFMLAILALLVCPVVLRCIWRSVYPSQAQQTWLLFALLAVLAVTIVDWSVRVFG